MGDAGQVIPLQPALGQNLQLGMLYDVRSSEFFGGLSLWKDADVNKVEDIEENKVQNADYKFTYSLDEARNENSLNVEGSLALDLKMVKAEGSAKYLSENKSSKHEARLNVSCNIERRTRRIPMEVLSKMTYEKLLDNPKFTHFVAEVVEGASATLTFARSCSSEEEAKKITGELKISIVKIPVSGEAKLDFKKETQSLMENVRISYSGALAENVTSFEDAKRVANEMPSKLAKQMNTLKYMLLPVSLLDSKVNRLIRSIDVSLINKTSDAIKAGHEISLALKDVVTNEVFQVQFPTIRKQISNFQTAFSAAETKFTTQARQILPQLRDGNTDENEKIAELEKAVAIFSRQIEIAQQFVDAKVGEADILRLSVTTLLDDEFENYLGGLPKKSLVGDVSPSLLVSVGGGVLGISKHTLQTALEAIPSSFEENGTPEEEEDLFEEWYAAPQTRSGLNKSCADIRQQRKLAIPGVHVSFGVGSVNLAFRNGKKVKTQIGDIVLDQEGRLVIVTGLLPKAPPTPKMTPDGQTMVVSWSSDRDEESELAIPTTRFALRYRRIPNPQKDGAFPRAIENESYREIECAVTESSVTLDFLSDDCDYEIALRFYTSIGASPWSQPAVGRTDKRMSEARSLIDFFTKEKASLTSKPSSSNDKPWDFDKDKKVIFLGNRELLRRKTNKIPEFANEIAVRIVDVATEYKPEIKVPQLDRPEQTIVVVFTGPSGAGKSTQINAFVSFLLGGEVDDPARIYLIDDRGLQQTDSVTQLVTCFRIRPLAPIFEGKTMLIVDTPGFGDSRGIKRDSFVTAAMSEFFGTVSHVNSIVFVCKAHEVRTTLLSPVATSVFSLFAKDVQRCLRTVYTFSDGGKILAHDTLEKLRWPVHNGEITVNNSAFTLDLKGGDITAKVREQWNESVKGQYILQSMLQKMTPVPTKGSAEVTQKRMLLEEKCGLAEKSILRTANEAQYIILQLSILAIAMGDAPNKLVPHKWTKAAHRSVPDGKHTTLCTVCNFTCHEICLYGNDDDKIHCVAMVNGNCTECKGKCSWTAHHNARFIIYPEEVTDMVKPEEMIQKWYKENTSKEGILIGLLDAYLLQQATLRGELLMLAELNDQLNQTALLHDSSGLVNYVDLLIKTAKAQNAPYEYLVQLQTARNTLKLLFELKEKEKKIGGDLIILVDVLNEVRDEMKRRVKLTADERVAEEEKPSSLYNALRQKLPLDIMAKAPPALSTSSTTLYKHNLEAVVSLVQLVLKDGGVVAALAATE